MIALYGVALGSPPPPQSTHFLLETYELLETHKYCDPSPSPATPWTSMSLTRKKAKAKYGGYVLYTKWCNRTSSPKKEKQMRFSSGGGGTAACAGDIFSPVCLWCGVRRVSQREMHDVKKSERRAISQKKNSYSTARTMRRSLFLPLVGFTK